MKYRNFYLCCDTEWQDEWDSTCNDRCPVCNKEIAPYKSEDIKMKTYPVSFDVKVRVDANLYSDTQLQDFVNHINYLFGNISMFIADGIEDDFDELAETLDIDLVSVEKR